jgi:hypothetical protein
MHSRFSAKTPVSIAVPDAPISIDNYLRDPDRLVNVLGDPRRIHKMSRDVYRIAIKPLSFLVLNLQPIVDLQVWTEPNGTVQLRSVGYEVRGVDYTRYGFSLELTGKLSPSMRHGRTSLMGRAALKVSVTLPPILQFTPKSLIEATGNAMLTGILSTIESRLRNDLIPDYQLWAQEMQRKAA